LRDAYLAPALFSALSAACAGPRASPGAPPVAGPSAANESEPERPHGSTPAPVELTERVPVALPGTALTATLVHAWLGGRVFEGEHGPNSAAQVTIAAADGRSETVVFPFFTEKTVLGARLYLDGSRESVYLFVVPNR
jgi:hypothetical protein